MIYDLIVIGSGPGGYVSVIRAAQLGMKVAIIEKEKLGGICLNWGCIPTKALLKSTQVFNYLNHAEDYGLSASNVFYDFDKIINRSRNVADKMNKGIEFLMRKNKIDVITGIAKLQVGKKITVEDTNGDKTEYSANHIIIATGARSKSLTNIPQDGVKIIGYREAMTLKNIPKSILVIGSGAIGVEFAYFYATLGVNVTIVEYQPNIVPVEDLDIAIQLEKSLKKIGVKILTSTSVEKVIQVNDTMVATLKSNISQDEEILEAEIVLSAVGTTPNTENIGIEDVGITTNKGKIVVNDYYQTNVAGYYAIGDIIPTQALAHVASAEGITCVEKIAGLVVDAIDYKNIPGCTYCSPEIASVGLTEKQAIEAGYELKIGKFPFSASGKATANGDNEGFVKVIFDAKYGEWLGCHMIGNGVTEMIAEAVVARKLETTGHEILKSIHPHPTLSEALMEAVAAAYEEVIHI